MEPNCASDFLKGMINTLMRKNQLSVDEVRRRLRGRNDPVHVHGRGKFECLCRPVGWTSAYTWLSVNLEDQMISKWWKMKCKMCRVGIEPRFSWEEGERMVEEAIRLFKGERRPYSPRKGPRIERPPPHNSELCEKCKWGAVRCWRAPPYRPPPPASNASSNAPSENGNTSASELGDTDRASSDSERE